MPALHHTLDVPNASAAAGGVMTSNLSVEHQQLVDRRHTEHVEVIPMQEELEVRLEEGTFPVPNDWHYDVKIDSDMVAAALGTTDEGGTEGGEKPTQNYPEYRYG